jgi:hypothetical protein
VLCSLTTLVAGASIAEISFAGVPSPANSTTPACVVACPLGDISATVIVRDIGNVPVPGSIVVLDFSDCPTPVFCDNCTDDYIYDAPSRTVRKVTAADGSVTFSLCAGGETCDGSLARIYADGVLLAATPYASPDQDGSLDVGPPDDALEQARILGGSADGDFDCNGLAMPNDLSILHDHFYHACPGVVPAKARTWGAVKILYR